MFIYYKRKSYGNKLQITGSCNEIIKNFKKIYTYIQCILQHWRLISMACQLIQGYFMPRG